MKYGVEKFYVFFSVLFYVGIVLVIYLYAVDDNTAVWLVAESMVLFGILGVGIPDTLINTEMGDINISIARGVILNKYFMFFTVFMYIDKYFLLVKVLVGVSMLTAFALEYCLVKQIRNANVPAGSFVDKLNRIDTSALDRVLGYYGVYIFSILLYLNIHSNLYEMGIMLLVNIVLHFVVSNKIIKSIKCAAKWKVRVVFWTVFVITIVTASYNCNMLTYSLVGTYIMISLDLLQKRKTSLISADFFEN